MAGSISDMSFTRASSSGTDLSAYFSLDDSYAYEGSKSLHYTGYSSYPAYVYPTSYLNTDTTGGLVRMRAMITGSSIRSSFWTHCGPCAMFSSNNTYGFAGIMKQDDTYGNDYAQFGIHSLSNVGELTTSQWSPLFYLSGSDYDNSKISSEDWVTLELRWEWINDTYIPGTTDNILVADFRVYNDDMSELFWNTSMQLTRTQIKAYRTTGRTGMFFDLGNSAADIWVDYFESYKV